MRAECHSVFFPRARASFHGKETIGAQATSILYRVFSLSSLLESLWLIRDGKEKCKRKTQLVVVALPVFTVKPPGKIAVGIGDTFMFNCSATGDPQPVISWKRQGAALPVGRSHRTNEALVLKDLREEDAGNYICVATSGGVLNIETISDVHVGSRGKLCIRLND